MKYIPLHGKILGKGKFAIVDDQDYEELSKYKWYLNGNGYVSRYVWKKTNNTRVQIHRQIIKPRKKQIVDHKNGNPLDNRRENLRICTKQQNSFNKFKPKNRSSRYLGVTVFNSKKPSGRIYRRIASRIKINGKVRYLGDYPSEHIAALVYDLWAIAERKDFAKTNFPVVAHG